MTENFFQTFVLLLLVTDPFGNVPLFISTLAHVKPERRSRVVVRECLIAFFCCWCSCLEVAIFWKRCN